MLKQSLAKQQREVIKFSMVCAQEHWQKIISVSIWNSMWLTHIMQRLRCGTVRDSKNIHVTIQEILNKNIDLFFNQFVFLGIILLTDFKPY